MSWPLVKLSELVEINIGRTPSRSNDSYWGEGHPWLSIADMSQGSNLAQTKEQITELAVKETKPNLAPKGTVLFSFKLSIGKVGITDVDMYHNEAIASFPIKERSLLCTEYLVYALQSLDYLASTDRAVMGATLNKKKLAELLIPLPPLPVQKKIAAVLEKADTLRSQCQQMEQALNSLAQSVFLDMFGDPVTNPKGWEQRTLQDVCSKVTDGTHQAPEWAEKGVPFLFISNIRNGQVDFNTNKFITERCYKELTRTTPIEINDILYTTVGSYGHVSIVDETFPKFCFQRHIAQIKPDKNKVNPSFLFYQLQTSAIKHLADVAVRGIAQKTLNLKDLKSFTILLPPKDLQAKLVERMDIIKSQSIRINTVSAKNHELFNSLMQRAFKGELDLKDVA